MQCHSPYSNEYPLAQLEQALLDSLGALGSVRAGPDVFDAGGEDDFHGREEVEEAEVDEDVDVLAVVGGGGLSHCVVL